MTAVTGALGSSSTSQFQTVLANSSSSSSGASTDLNAGIRSNTVLDSLFGFIPGVSASSTPFGNAIFAYELALVAGAPFVLRRVLDVEEKPGEKKSRVWKW